MTTGLGGSTASAELTRLAAWVPPAAQPIPDGAYAARLQKARRSMVEGGSDALLINAGKSLLYYTGIDWTPSERLVALLLARDAEPVMICPMFEAETLKAALRIEAEILTWEEDADPMVLVAETLRGWRARSVAVDPEVGFGFVDRLRQGGASFDLESAAAIIDGCRVYKSPAELAIMTRVKAMTLEVQRSVARILFEGITTTEVQRFIDDAHRAVGAEGSTFKIVQFGITTTHMHASPPNLALEEGQMVIVDTGCSLWGYNSDITRSYVFGDPDREQSSYWQLELDAQRAAFEAARPGVACEDVDAAARTVLERAGLGPDYRLPGLPHRTGHGIGLSIHEPLYLVRGNRVPLSQGMCFSNEPMIVIPGRFGIRIEDHFHITQDGAAWFTQPPVSITSPVG